MNPDKPYIVMSVNGINGGIMDVTIDLKSMVRRVLYSTKILPI